MPNKILVAYASRAGSTAGVAEAIGKTLIESGAQVDVIPMKDVKDLTPYRAVIAGSAIRKSKWLRQLIACGAREELVKLVGHQTRIDLTLNVEASRVLEAWQTVEGVARVSGEADRVTVLVEDSNLALPHLFESATRLSARITSVDIQEPNLEAVFLHLTGRALRD